MATKTATKAKTQKSDELTLTGYCMKTKEKDVPIQEAVISLVKGKYIAKGHDDDGNTITTIMGKEKAEACIEAGIAEAGPGIAEEEAPKKKKK